MIELRGPLDALSGSHYTDRHGVLQTYNRGICVRDGLGRTVFVASEWG